MLAAIAPLATVDTRAGGVHVAAASETETPGWLGNVPGLGEVAPDEPPASRMDLSGCTITNPLFEDDPGRVRELVPQDYELGTNAYFGPSAATIMVAVLACDRAGTGGERVVLSLVAAQVLAEDSPGGAGDDAWDAYNQSTLNFLPSSSWYLLAVHTDNAAVAGELRAAGLEPVLAEGITFETDYAGSAKSDTVTVPLPPEHAYQMATTTLLADPFVHNHDWLFWSDGPKGRAGFLLHLHAMEDSSCGYHLSPQVQATSPSCGTALTAEPGSRVAELLDFGAASSRETPYTFTHPEKSPAGNYIALIPAQPSSAS